LQRPCKRPTGNTKRNGQHKRTERPGPGNGAFLFKYFHYHTIELLETIRIFFIIAFIPIS
jgi:hypothetical protein